MTTDGTEGLIRVEQRGAIELVLLCRPEKRNALPSSFFVELPVVLAAAVARGAQAVVISGEGTTFSAGADLRELALDAGVGTIRGQIEAVLDCLDACDNCPIPIIAAVNGPAYGVAVALLMACDGVFADENSKFSFREVRHGVLPAAALLRITGVIGRQWARWAILSGADISVTEAMTIGLVQRVSESGQTLADALAAAELIASHPPRAVSAAKRLLTGSTPTREEVIVATGALRESDEHRVRVAAALTRDG